MFLRHCLVATVLAIGCACSSGQILYDGSLQTLPANQGWGYLALGSATQTLTNNAVLLDTSASMGTQAGYSRIAPPPLNRTNGFTLLFAVQMHAEAHSSANRAGFSVIALADDKRGLELGFWTDRIFAQSDNPLFTHAEEAVFATTNAFVNYALTILATNYVLRANGAVILSGPVRDYTSFSGPINPYSTPDFVFFGDDTTSASAAMSLQSVVLVTPPTLSISRAGVVSWTGVVHQSYTIQGSSQLTTWSNLAAVTSASSNFSYTNNSDSRFFRVVYP